MKQQILFEEIQNICSEEEVQRYKCSKITFIKAHYICSFYAAFIVFKDEDDLSENWKKLNSLVATKMSSILTDDFSKWNFYLFFIIDKPLIKEIKYVIENNTFSSRKIVLDNFKKELNNDTILKIINEKIVGTDIIIKAISAQPKTKYVSTSNIWNIITEIDLKTGKGNVEKTDKQLEKIENKLSNEI